MVSKPSSVIRIRLTRSCVDRSPASLSADPCTRSRTAQTGQANMKYVCTSRRITHVCKSDRNVEGIGRRPLHSLRYKSFIETKDDRSIFLLAQGCAQSRFDVVMSPDSPAGRNLSNSGEDSKFLDQARQLLHKRLKVRSLLLAQSAYLETRCDLYA